MKRSRLQIAGVALLLAGTCVAIVLIRAPRHGLLLTRYATESFERPAGPPTVDATLHFSSDEPNRPVPAWVRPHSSARWTGYLDIPRTAIYTLGLVSDDGGWLYVDDALRVDLHGVHNRRGGTTDIRLTQGYHRIRIDWFQADGGATMKFAWHRSGNNSTYEIVPLSMLYPEQPAPLTWFDRVLRLAPWLLLLLAGWLLRPRSFPAHAVPIRRRAYACAALVFLFALGVRVHDLLGEGETCDQWTYVSAGYVYAQNVAAGITDADQWAWNSEHPAIGKLIYGAVQYVFGTETWISNVAAATMGALTVLTIFWVGLRLFGLAGGLAASLVLALIPSFVAHGRVAALDTPATLFFTLALALLVRALHDERGREASFFLMAGATGLAIGTKLSNALVLPLMAVVILTMYGRYLLRLRWRHIPLALYLLPLIAFLPTVATWPWLWTNPLQHFQSTHGHWQFAPRDVFLGEVGPPPASYFLVAFACVVPIGLYPPFLVALAQPFRKKADAVFAPLPTGSAFSARAFWLLLLAWFLVPFAWTFASFRMNNVRYVLNAFPPFALLAGIGLVLLGRVFGLPLAARVVPVLIAATAVYLIVVDARIHPYYLDYYNEAAGGTLRVTQRRMFDTGWWGEGLDTAFDWMNAHAPPGATYMLDAYSPPGVLLAREDMRETGGTPDYIVSQIFNFHTVGVGYDLVHTVTAGGAPIVKVFRRPLKRAGSPPIISAKPQ